MRILLLRGAVPSDRDPNEILFDDIEKCDDIYTLLINKMSDPGDHSQVWYWNRPKGFRKAWENDNIQIQYEVPLWKPIPDIIWSRGGFKEQVKILNSYNTVPKVYYGAGIRFCPQDGVKYDLILVDSEYQKKKVQKKHPKTRVELWIKPAPEFFKPPDKYEPQFDVCFIANGTQAVKGHDFVARTCPKDLFVMHLGFKSKVDKLPNVRRNRVLKRNMPRQIHRCKVGILPYDKNDSCPRALVEMYACGLPIVALDTVRFWKEKYRGVLTPDKEHFWKTVRSAIECAKKVREPMIKYYSENLSMDAAAGYLKTLFQEVIDERRNH